MPFYLVQKGNGLGTGRIVARGSDHNIWETQNSIHVPWKELSPADAYQEGVQIKPGTATDQLAGEIESEMQELGVDPFSETADTGDTYSELLRGVTMSYPHGHAKHRCPFRIDYPLICVRKDRY